jgi:hypothetical protein
MEKNDTLQRIRRIAGEVISQLLNVPILSGILVTILYFQLPETTPNRWSGYLWSMIFLSLVPLCSLFFYIPGKTKDRETVVRRQRNASFVFMLVSYPIGMLVLTRMGAPRVFEAIATTYTLVTVGLIIFNLFLHFKASGHAAGVAGPVTALVYLYGLIAAPLVALLPLVTWARVAAKGHNVWQTVVGAGLSLTIGVSVLIAYGFTPFSGKLW